MGRAELSFRCYMGFWPEDDLHRLTDILRDSAHHAAWVPHGRRLAARHQAPEVFWTPSVPTATLGLS